MTDLIHKNDKEKPSAQAPLSEAAQARLQQAQALRERRLAQALRENLKRRKAQARNRAED